MYISIYVWYLHVSIHVYCSVHCSYPGCTLPLHLTFCQNTTCMVAYKYCTPSCSIRYNTQDVTNNSRVNTRVFDTSLAAHARNRFGAGKSAYSTDNSTVVCDRDKQCVYCIQCKGSPISPPLSHTQWRRRHLWMCVTVNTSPPSGLLELLNDDDKQKNYMWFLSNIPRGLWTLSQTVSRNHVLGNGCTNVGLDSPDRFGVNTCHVILFVYTVKVTVVHGSLHGAMIYTRGFTSHAI